jgi:hypothetical protein
MCDDIQHEHLQSEVAGSSSKETTERIVFLFHILSLLHTHSHMPVHAPEFHSRKSTITLLISFGTRNLANTCFTLLRDKCLESRAVQTTACHVLMT